MKLKTWLVRFNRRKHETTFLTTLDELNHFKNLVSRQPCPACGQNGLELKNFVRNPEGWDAEVTHPNCTFHGIVNSSGFDFKEINSKGRARRER